MVSTLEWIYSKPGTPQKALQLVERELEPLGPHTIYLKFLASPVNPSDLAQIEGVYPSKGKLRKDGTIVAGNEGVAEVIAVGESVSKVKVGDWVVPRKFLGTWRTHAETTEEDVVVLQPGLSVEEAATLAVNPPTALLMLNDFVELKEGSIVVQNGANSAVGLAVIQMAKLRNIYTVNVIRDRPEFDELAQTLKDLGANEVLREGELKERKLEADLAFDCVGGASASDLIASLKRSGTIVNYGGMSRQPLTVPVPALIFKDIRLCGFWLAKWRRDASLEKHTEMLSTIHGMYKSKQLSAGPITKVNFRQITEHLPSATKLLIQFNNE